MECVWLRARPLRQRPRPPATCSERTTPQRNRCCCTGRGHRHDHRLSWLQRAGRSAAGEGAEWADLHADLGHRVRAIRFLHVRPEGAFHWAGPKTAAWPRLRFDRESRSNTRSHTWHTIWANPVQFAFGRLPRSTWRPSARATGSCWRTQASSASIRRRRRQQARERETERWPTVESLPPSVGFHTLV